VDALAEMTFSTLEYVYDVCPALIKYNFEADVSRAITSSLYVIFLELRPSLIPTKNK
jgi:hypothetical protein